VHMRARRLSLSARSGESSNFEAGWRRVELGLLFAAESRQKLDD
jgi:hypothetical protein